MKPLSRKSEQKWTEIIFVDLVEIIKHIKAELTGMHFLIMT